MLQRIRERTQGWIAVVIFSLVALTFVFFGLQYYLTSSSGANKSLATVNGQAITQKQVDQAFQQILRKRRLTGVKTPLSPDQRRQLKSMVLERLVQAQVLEQGLTHSGFQVSLEDAQQMVMRLPQFQEKGKFSPRRFQELLYIAHLSQPLFFQRLQFQMMQQQLASGLLSTAFVLPFELEQAAHLLGQTRDVGYFVLTKKALSRPVTVSEKEVKAFYQANQLSFKAPEKVSLSYVTLEPTALVKQVSVPESDLKAYYKTHKAQFKGKPYLSARAKIRRLLVHQKAQVLLSKQGQKLSELAYTHSHSLVPVAKALGLAVKTTPLFPRSGAKEGLAAHPRIVAEAFSRDVLRDKNNSRPISLKDGTVVVIRLQSYQPEHVMPLKQWRSKIQQTLKSQKTQRALGLLAYHIQSAFKSPQDIASIEKHYSVHWQVARGLRLSGEEQDAEFKAKVFTSTPNKVQSVALQQGEYRVFKVLAVNLGKINTTDAKKKIIQHRSALAQFMGDMAYRSFIRTLEGRAKIKRD